MKTAIRVLPVNIYDISALESYFDHMSKKGFHFKSMKGIFCLFEKGQPLGAKYRLEPVTKNDEQELPCADVLEHYEQCGWKYAYAIAKLFHLYKSTADNPIEPHTDPVVHGYAFDYVNKKIRNITIITVTTYIALMAMVLFGIFGHPAPLKYLIEQQSSLITLALLLLIIIEGFTLIFTMNSVKKLRQNLLNGREYSHNKVYKPNYGQIFTLLLTLAVLIAPLFLNAYKASSAWDVTTEGYTPLPAVSLQAFENHPSFEKSPFIYKDKDLLNRVYYKWGELCDIYNTKENGLIPGKLVNGFESYSPSMDTTIYDLKLPFLADILYRDVIRDETRMDVHKGKGASTILDTPFDQVAVIKSNGAQFLACKYKDKVVSLSYMGDKEIEMIINDLFDVVKNLE